MYTIQTNGAYGLAGSTPYHGARWIVFKRDGHLVAHDLSWSQAWTLALMLNRLEAATVHKPTAGVADESSD
jgi:hypothetical protein